MKKNFRLAVVFGCTIFFNQAFSQDWSLTGNAGIDATTNFVGTTDNKPLVLRTNNVERMRLTSGGKIGIGTKTPAAYLHLFGTMQIENNSGTIYDEPLLTLRNSGANGTFTNPVIAFKHEDTLFATLGYDVSTRDFGIDAQPALYASNFIINHDNGFVGLNTKTPSYRLDVSGSSRFLGNMGIQTIPGTRTLQVGNTTGAIIGIGSLETIQDGGSLILSVNSNLVPYTDNYSSLGNSTNRWKDVWAVDGTINTSDARDKTNIRDLNYGLKDIMKLRPVKFNWKNNADEGDKLGVIAQEIKKVLPEVVSDWEYEIDEVTGKRTKVPAARLGVMYADIIPVLIKGMQELSKKNDELKSEMNELKSIIVSGNQTLISQQRETRNEKPEMVLLQQNTPNPFYKTTSISYNIPSGFKNAQLLICDNNGRTLKQIQITNGGAGSVNIDGSSLISGTYNYSLIVDEKMIDSKKMILTK